MKICICSSAGSANLLINSLNSRSYKYVIKNQSRDLLKSVLPKKNIISLSEAKKKGSTFFIGTGDEFSKDCIIKIKKKGKYVVSIFDHWINYEKRINKNFLPDEAWVYDEKAKKILKNIFPKLRIKQKKNMYFINEKKKFLKLKKSQDDILYISEPLDKNRDIKSLIFFIKILEKSKINYQNLLIKIHPREKINKYKKLFKRKKIKVKFFKNIELTKLLSKSKFVVGRNSMGLALSAWLGVKTFYCIPKGCGKFKLPIERIKRFRYNHII